VRRLGPLVAVLALLTAVSCEAGGADTTIALWRMNEGWASSTMLDSGPKGINGSVGSAVQTGVNHAGAKGYRWPWTNPGAPPAKPQRLVRVSDARVNPGSRDYSVTVRFRTTAASGNMLQKGQALTPGGFFKIEVPGGRAYCLFTSRDSRGNLRGQHEVRSPRKLNDGAWHTLRCEKRADQVIMTVDGSTVVRSGVGRIGPIANSLPLTIGGKSQCDQVTVDCDYFSGHIDWVRIQASSG
jgi:hypothetical protein